jgi:hypothetical protein
MAGTVAIDITTTVGIEDTTTTGGVITEAGATMVGATAEDIGLTTMVLMAEVPVDRRVE